MRFSWAGGLPKRWVISCLIFSRSVPTISFDRGSGQLVRNLLLLSASKCCCLAWLASIRNPHHFTLPTPIVFLPVALLFYCNGNRLDIGWNNNDKIRGKQVWTFLVIIVGLRVNYLQVSSTFWHPLHRAQCNVDIMIENFKRTNVCILEPFLRLERLMISWSHYTYNGSHDVLLRQFLAYLESQLLH